MNEFVGRVGMLNGALFAIIEEATSAVLILSEETEQAELLASRLTRAEVQRQLLIIADMMAELSAEMRKQMPELEWDGWATTGRALRAGSKDEAGEALWFAARSLVPATVMWLRVYRRNQPELFTFQA
jgi:uncharacterized protein with HEPN domain